jgi:gag-polypeptide of LTR copia-type
VRPRFNFGQSSTRFTNSQSLARRELKLQLQTAKKGRSTCVQYIQSIQSLVDRLRSVGSEVSEEDLILYTLQRLGNEYENFVKVVSMRSGTLSLSELQSLLFSHEARLKASLASLISSPLVNHANSTASQNSTFGTSYSQSNALYAGLSQPHNPQFPAGEYYNRGRGRGYNRGKGRGRFHSNASDKP